MQEDLKSEKDDDDDDDDEEEEEERWHTLLTYRRVTFLLDHGADPNTRDAEGNSVLLDVTRAGRADLVALLLGAGADVTRTNDAGECDVVALARKLPPAQAARMVAVLLPAVQVALEKRRLAAMRRGSASDGSSEMAGQGEDEVGALPPGTERGGAGGGGLGTNAEEEEEAAAPFLLSIFVLVH